MALFSGAGSRIASSVPSSADAAAPYIQWLARFGYAARGIVYFIIGIIALQAAFSSGQRPEDSSGALQFVLRQPFGRVLLGALAVGLAGWVLWRLFQAFRDPEEIGGSAKGSVKRIGYVISALLYGALSVEAVRLLMGNGGGQSSESSADHWTGVIMSQPAGRWIVAGVAGVIMLFGFYEIVRGFRADFRQRLDLTSLSPEVQRRLVGFGRFGMVARGIVFGIIGWFLLRAALQYDPEEAGGVQSALQTLEEQSYGPWLLGVVGAGLLCFGLFELAEARYRIIRVQRS